MRIIVLGEVAAPSFVLDVLNPAGGLCLAAASERTAKEGAAPSSAAMPPTVRAAATATEPAIRSWKLRSTCRRARGAWAFMREIIAFVSGCS